MVRRRHRTPEGVDYWTVELPEAVFKSVTRFDRLDTRLASFKRSLARRGTEAKAKRLLAEGVKPAAVAQMLGIVDRTAQKYRRQMKRTK
jgi:hypothetical protein